MSSQPSLSLSIDTPPSSSPFPSPSSSFIPPPMMGVHEFAVKPAPAGRKNSIASKGSGQAQEKEKAQSNGIVGSDPSSSHTTEHVKPPLPSAAAASTSTPTTPTPNSVFSPPVVPQSQKQPPPSPLSTQTQTPSESITIPDPPTPTSAVSSSSNTNRLSAPFSHRPHRDSTISNTSTTSSLTSNRPAPPSPAVSRRASKRVSQGKRISSLAMSSSTSSSTAEERDPPAPAHKPIVIKDFAYKSDDPRMKGLGIDVPRPNRVTVLNKKLMGQLEYKSWKRQAGFSNTSDDDDDDDSETETETEMEEDDASWGGSGAGGMGAFRFGLGRFSWGGGTSASGSSTQATSAGFPTRGDLEMNFTQGDDDDDDDDDEEDDDYEEEEEEEEDLVPGIYRALYAFEPEGTAEMGLEEDQLVKVVGRGGGVGWAVVVSDGEHKLVPESYLELVKADQEEDG